MSSNFSMQEIEEALKSLPSPTYDDLLPVVRKLLCENLEKRSSRVERFFKNNGVRNLADYALQIAQTIRRDGEIINRLAANDEETWLQIRTYYYQKSYQQLLASGADLGHAYQRADDFAQQMCLKLLTNRFPGDVPFIAWHNKIAKNEFLEMCSRGADVLDKPDKVTSLEFEDGEEKILNAHLVEPGFTETFNQTLSLNAAISRLPIQTQRTVLEMLLLNATEDEIAVVMGKSIQAIYNLRHRAVQDLGQVWRSEMPSFESSASV